MKINKQNFEQVAKLLGYSVEPEFKFLPDRRFRADWKVSKNEKNVLIEYEGLSFRPATKSRHTTVGGFSNDCEKYNLAQLAGYTILRYTVLNFDQVAADLEKFFEVR